MLTQQTFAITGLTSRGGRSSWVFFFCPTELVMVDLGSGPALTAGFKAGLGNATPSWGPQQNPNQTVEQWCADLKAKAKNVVVLKDEQIATLRLWLRMLTHQLFVVRTDGTEEKFQLTNREEGEAHRDALERGLGPRFQVSKTPVYGFLDQHASFLLR